LLFISFAIVLLKESNTRAELCFFFVSIELESLLYFHYIASNLYTNSYFARKI